MKPLMIEGRPHWEVRFPEEVWPAFEDFRNFLTLVWDHLGLPVPTRAQYEIAHRLQWGKDSQELFDALMGMSDEEAAEYMAAILEVPRQDIIRAFRGIGKSYVTASFAIWRLMRNPRDEKILVVSATGSKSKEFVDQVKGILQSMPLVQWLLDGEREGGARRRDMADRFDVSGASNSQAFSVKAVGMTGQVTGSRATLVIADDIEIVENSKTEDARQRIITIVREFGVIVKTEIRGDIIFLGTPQTEESIYNFLVKEMGFSCFTIPVRFPRADKLDGYILKNMDGQDVNILAYYLRAAHDAGELPHGALTDPQRFTLEELAKEEAKGPSYFALQMMLDTSLSDAERYPLKQHDLIVMSLNPNKAPITIQWGRDTDKRNLINDIPNLGFSGDHLLRPLFVDKEWREYEGTVLFVDPAGRGKDETAWSIVASLSGTLFLLDVGAWVGDPAEAMWKIAVDAKRYNVNVIEVEPNFGQGMWVAAFQPVLNKVWPGGCTVQESEWAKGQKETRIIDTLEPVLTQHRLVVNEDLIRRDVRTATEQGANRVYSLIYQLTHITRDRGSLPHDDRLDSLAGAVNYWQRNMAQDTQEAAQAILEAEREAFIEDFIEMFEDGGAAMYRRRGKLKGDGTRDEVFIYNW